MVEGQEGMVRTIGRVRLEEKKLKERGSWEGMYKIVKKQID